VARYGKGRVAKAVLISSVLPVMVKSAKNPGGTPIDVFDRIRESTAKDRAQFYQDITLPFCGYNRPGAKISQGVRDNWWRQGMMGGIKAQYQLISPDGCFKAVFHGGEFGMSSPTVGKIEIRAVDERVLFSFRSYAESSFSDDSRYFIYVRELPRIGDRTGVTVVDLKTGMKAWILQWSFPPKELIELRNSNVQLSVNGREITNLTDEDALFDISHCMFVKD
jgi:hypothetical protein